MGPRRPAPVQPCSTREMGCHARMRRGDVRSALRWFGPALPERVVVLRARGHVFLAVMRRVLPRRRSGAAAFTGVTPFCHTTFTVSCDRMRAAAGQQWAFPLKTGREKT